MAEIDRMIMQSLHSLIVKIYRNVTMFPRAKNDAI